MHDANRKILLENVSDNMHPAVTHQSAWQPAKQAAGEYPEDEKPLPLAMPEPFGSSYDFFDTIAMTTCGNGHTWSGSNATIHTGYPRESKYVQDLAARHGEEKAKRVLSQQRQNTIIYPSIAFKSALQTIHPQISADYLLLLLDFMPGLSNYSPPCSFFLHFSSLVIPAKAGIQSIKLSLAIHYNVSFQDNAFHWIPAFAGMTNREGE